MSFRKRHDRTQTIMLALCGIVLLGVILYTAVSQKEDAPMTNLEFFQSLDYEDGLPRRSYTLTNKFDTEVRP